MADFRFILLKSEEFTNLIYLVALKRADLVLIGIVLKVTDNSLPQFTTAIISRQWNHWSFVAWRDNNPFTAA